jgi:predicted HTH transcriptional regulator
MKNNLEQIYEQMMNPVLLRVVRQPAPLSPVKIIKATREEMEDEKHEENEEEMEEDLTEKQEVEIAREILTHVSELDDIAKEAMYKSFRKKIESCSDKIRKLVNELIEGHGYDV